ncbi:MAG: hypothetical protein ACMUEL_03340 [Flavobacteriales bacterium Tduv]
MSLFAPNGNYLRSVGSKGRVTKINQSKKSKGKKRESIRSRHSRKIAQKIT